MSNICAPNYLDKLDVLNNINIMQCIFHFTVSVIQTQLTNKMYAGFLSIIYKYCETLQKVDETFKKDRTTTKRVLFHKKL